jgi:hypothetical protein
MDELSLLIAVNRWVGVAIALVGSVVVAPDGTRLLWRSAWVWSLRQLGRLLPRRLFAWSLISGAGGGGISFDWPIPPTIPREWTPDAPVDERIEALRQHLTEIEARLDEAIKRLRTETSSRKVAINELNRTLRAETAELRRLVEERDRHAAVVDARGLPVIGIGIVLSGVPEALAALPWHLGWLVPTLGVAAAVTAVSHAVRQYFLRRSRETGQPDDPGSG